MLSETRHWRDPDIAPDGYIQFCLAAVQASRILVLTCAAPISGRTLRCTVRTLMASSVRPASSIDNSLRSSASSTGGRDRSGRSVTWLAEQGYPAPAEDRIKVGIAYVTWLRLDPDIRPAEEMT